MKDQLTRNCRNCLKQFFVTVNTALHKTHTSLVKWIQAIELIADKPPISGADLANDIGVTVITAYRMMGIIREGIRNPQFLFSPPRPKAQHRYGRILKPPGVYDESENLDESFSRSRLRKWFSGIRGSKFHIISLILDKRAATLKEAYRYLVTMKAPAYLLIDGQVSAYQDGKVGISVGPLSAERLKSAGARLQKAGSYGESLPIETYLIRPL